MNRFFVFGALVALIGCQHQFERRVAEAAYCEQDEECVVIRGKCPYACFVAVNEDEVNSIETYIESLPGDCALRCMPEGAAACDAGRCTLVGSDTGR